MSGPLDGIRGIVLTQAWAGTYCTELLAMAGCQELMVPGSPILDQTSSVDAERWVRTVTVCIVVSSWLGFVFMVSPDYRRTRSATSGSSPIRVKIGEFPDAPYLMQRPCSTANMAAPGRVRVPILS